ncbi:hypothetical protein Z951_29895 [Streptomyces sp. PRh5]|nr:hypothetical protein Z951_29895 [Streptomyces sp. PRh5]
MSAAVSEFAGLAPGPAPLAPYRRQTVDQRQELRDVVAVPAGMRHPQRGAVRVGQHVVLRARPRTVNRTRTDFWAASPPLGPHMRGIDRDAGEVQPVRRPQPVQQHPLELLPHSGFAPWVRV